MSDLSHQIYKYRILYAAAWLSLLFSVVYAINHNAGWLLMWSYLWGRFVTFTGVQIALHRYFCHRAFVTSPAKHRFLLWFSILSGEGSALAWTTHHRHHHRYSDRPNDLHSPAESKWLSMFLWQIKPKSWWLETKQLKTLPRDLMRDNELRFVDHYYYHIWLALVLFTAMISWKITVFFLLAPAGWALFHAIGVNFVSHWSIPGSYRNFDTPDQSYNNKWVARYLGGEGLHNNHHQYPARYNQAISLGEFDLAGWCIEKFFMKEKL